MVDPTDLTRDELLSIRDEIVRSPSLQSSATELTIVNMALRALDQEADARLGVLLRSILAETGHDADSLDAAEGDPGRAGLADLALRLAAVLREEVDHGT